MTPPKIDVRRIVLGIVDQNPEARKAYLHEPALHHGVEVTIGVLSRAADILTTRAGHSHPEAEAIIREIAVACSHSGGGQEDQLALAAANGELHPLPGSITIPVNRRSVLAAAVLRAHLKQDITGCICGWADLGKPHFEHVLAELLDAGALDPPPPVMTGQEAIGCPEALVTRLARLLPEPSNPLGLPAAKLHNQLYGQARLCADEIWSVGYAAGAGAQERLHGHHAKDLQRLFDLQQTRMGEATERWRAEDPAARAQVLPDLGDLLRWLMDQADKAQGHDRAVELIRELYTLHPTGGPLHVALDDYNLDDHWLPFTPAYTIPGNGLRPPSPDTYDPRTHQLCDEIAGLLNGMTEEQREHAVRTAHATTPNGADQ